MKLTRSMFFFDIFLRHFRWMVDREVDWPVWVVLGRSWGLCVRSWAALGAYVGGLGAVLGPTLAILSLSWASIGGLGCTWAALGACVGDLGPLLEVANMLMAHPFCTSSAVAHTIDDGMGSTLLPSTTLVAVGVNKRATFGHDRVPA